jgi:hypothetical protein
MTVKTKRLDLTVDINSGSALLLFVLSFFLLLVFVSVSPAVEKEFIPALTGLTGAFGGFLYKRANNNKNMLEETKAKLECTNGSVDK